MFLIITHNRILLLLLKNMLDLVAIPEFSAGAMENWGLILYRETSLIYNELVNTLHVKQWVTVVVAHELAHQV